MRHRGRRPIEVELTPLHEPAIADIASVVADRELLDVALRRLDRRQRAVVVLHYYLGLPLPDVAASLGIPVGTAKSRLHRVARARCAPRSMRTPMPRAAPVAGGQFA